MLKFPKEIKPCSPYEFFFGDPAFSPNPKDAGRTDIRRSLSIANSEEEADV